MEGLGGGSGWRVLPVRSSILAIETVQACLIVLHITIIQPCKSRHKPSTSPHGDHPLGGARWQEQQPHGRNWWCAWHSRELGAVL